MENSAERAGLYALVAVEVPALFSVFNPSMFFTTRRFGNESESVGDIRRGCLFATGTAVVMGISVALIDRSVWPIVLALVMSALMWYGYEWSIKHPREDSVDMAGTQVGRSS